MYLDLFHYLGQRRTQRLQKRNNNWRKVLSVRLRMSLMLLCIATGIELTEIHHSFRVGFSIVSKVVDGKQCTLGTLSTPPHSGILYYNYKKLCSIIFQEKRS